MNTDERIDTIEKHVHALQAEQADLTGQLAAARVDLWRSRVEGLQLQVHLATMSGNERLTLLSESLRNSWDRTQAQVEDASTAASTATETVWTALESAYRDVRAALIESKTQLKR